MIDGYYLNQGGLNLCDVNGTNVGMNPYVDDGSGSFNQTLIPTDIIRYCEFEYMFEQDIAKSVDIDSRRVQVLFIKEAAPDASLVHFRIYPPFINQDASAIAVSPEVNVVNTTLDYDSGVVTTSSTLGRQSEADVLTVLQTLSSQLQDPTSIIFYGTLFAWFLPPYSLHFLSAESHVKKSFSPHYSHPLPP